jgi:hypothetical protein
MFDVFETSDGAVRTVADVLVDGDRIRLVCTSGEELSFQRATKLRALS